MSVRANPVPDIPTLNCVGTISVATKDGSHIAYTKEGTNYQIIAFDFVADPMTTGVNGRTWVTLNDRQFDPYSDSSEFLPWQRQNFDRWFLKGGQSRFAVLQHLTEEDGDGWLRKLEQHFDSDTGITDMQAIAQEIASRIDGKTIGYQVKQERQKAGVNPDTGKMEYVNTDRYVIGDIFFDPAGKPPRNGQNTF